MPAERRVVEIIDNCRKVRGWRGKVWRAHKYGWDSKRKRDRTASDFAHTVETIGRWHYGKDHPEQDRFPALYTSLLGHVAEGEFLRHLDSQQRGIGGHIDLKANRYRVSELEVELPRVFDLCDLATLEVTCAELCRDEDYRFPQQLAAEAGKQGAAGLLVWSCAVEPECSQVNLIVFPDGLPPDAIRETGVWTAIRPLK